MLVISGVFAWMFGILVVILILPMELRLLLLVFRMSAAILRVRAVAVLPLDFVGRLRVLRTMHLPGSLHGAEASLVSVAGLRKLRTFVWWLSLG